MRKSLLTLGLATLALSSFGATRILYQQNYDTMNDVADSGWTNGGMASLDLVSDAYGKFIQLNLGQNNGRSGTLTWGQDIFLNEAGETILTDGKYTVEFLYRTDKGSTNQYNGAITVFTNHTPVTNNPYRNPWSPAGYWQNYLFDMSQVANESLGFVINGGTLETVGEDGTISYAIDYTDSQTLSEGIWYIVKLDVDVNSRTVDYSMATGLGEELQSGTIEVPETDINGDAINMYAEGIHAMLARYQTICAFDDIRIYLDTDYDWANKPSVALSRVGQTADEDLSLNLRAYTISFIDGETLHVTGTDGVTVDVDYADCEGAYVYETTKSGVMKAWTTNGSATSSVVETNIDCVPCVLPAAEATISAVSEGYAKTYTLTVDNKSVPMGPVIYIDYEFTGDDGTVLSGEGLTSGGSVSVPSKGTLKLTTAAWGYQSYTATVMNDIEFKAKKTWDFARMTEEELKDHGFETWEVKNSSATSGFDNWTGRKRLYYLVEGSEHENEEGAIVWDNYYPFGFVSEDSEDQVIKFSLIDRSAVPTTTKGEIFEGLTIFPERGKVDEGGLPNVGMMLHIGLYNDQTKNNNNNIYIHDLDQNDFVAVNGIDNYGGDSCHPICATTEEYYAQLAGTDEVFSVAKSGTKNEETGLYDLTYALYRIQKAVTKITVYAGEGSGVEAVEAAPAGDGYYYTIDGLRLAEPTRPGLYIHNGKKIIVK